MPGQVQPDTTFLKYTMDEVMPVEAPGAISPATIITDGGSFWLRTEVAVSGTFWPVANLLNYEICHHLEPVEPGGPVITLPLAGGAFGAVAGILFPPPPAALSVVTGPYLVGAVPGALLIPGTYRVLTHMHTVPPSAPFFRQRIGGFYDGLVIEVLPAP
jgi:hypothetical protein